MKRGWAVAGSPGAGPAGKLAVAEMGEKVSRVLTALLTPYLCSRLGWCPTSPAPPRPNNDGAASEMLLLLPRASLHTAAHHQDGRISVEAATLENSMPFACGCVPKTDAFAFAVACQRLMPFACGCVPTTDAFCLLLLHGAVGVGP